MEIASSLIEHLILVISAVVFSILLGVPLGIVAYFESHVSKAILWVAEILQTIPALALLGLVMIVFGPGRVTVITGLVAYSLLPIVHNTYVGLSTVDPGIREAGKGMGLSKLDRLVSVEVPLAFPMIFTGIRIATVTTVGVAVFATSVGGGGLGSVIYRGIRTQNIELILIGTVALMLMAIAFEGVMILISRRIVKERVK